MFWRSSWSLVEVIEELAVLCWGDAEALGGHGHLAEDTLFGEAVESSLVFPFEDAHGGSIDAGGEFLDGDGGVVVVGHVRYSFLRTFTNKDIYGSETIPVGILLLLGK